MCEKKGSQLIYIIRCGNQSAFWRLVPVQDHKVLWWFLWLSIKSPSKLFMHLTAVCGLQSKRWLFSCGKWKSAESLLQTAKLTVLKPSLILVVTQKIWCHSANEFSGNSEKLSVPCFYGGFFCLLLNECQDTALLVSPWEKSSIRTGHITLNHQWTYSSCLSVKHLCIEAYLNQMFFSAAHETNKIKKLLIIFM